MFKDDMQLRGHGGQPRLILPADVALFRSQRHDAVKRPGVQIVESQVFGNALRDRPFAAGGGAVDGDDGDQIGCAHWVMVP